MRLRLLQREIPGHDLGDTARLGPGDTVAVKQGVGRDGDEANRRERRDAQRQPQLQIDGGRAGRHGVGCLSQASSPSSCLASNIEANFAGKKAGQEGQDKIGYFTRPIQGKLPFRKPADRAISRRVRQFRVSSSEVIHAHIALILAPAIVLAVLAAAGAADTAAPSPIKIAVFPFELEDFSAGAAYVPPDDIDREQLRLSTEEARRLIAASGRYQLVDVSAVNDQAAKAGKLRDCEGCDARIAAGLDADQSMIGIVTRITRMEYAVTYKIRDARSGALVDVEQTDLRMGANVAWSRGARWLIQNRLLEQAQ